ncbi:MAG: Uma2 family endonuclease [Hydrococcus sp. C42_A2020_068]|nr:Uma2 family endonuclease [Hydrococcus sp. C42_A2020_068]
MVTLKLEPVIHLSAEQFTQLCYANPDAKLELTARGELVVMSPTGGESGSRNLKLSQRLGNWTDSDGTGIAFDSSTMFQLPNSSFRSPDASWISLVQWNNLSADERQTFPPICPEFVAELRSPSDSLKDLRDKMQEYIDNGARLGWLLDPMSKMVEIYRPGQPPEILQNPSQLSGENVLPGFVLDLEGILY